MFQYLFLVITALALLAPGGAGAVTLTFTAGPNGAISGPTTQAVATGGSSTAVSAVPNAGYYLLNWTGTGGFVATTANPLTLSNVTADQTITANFAFGNFDLVWHGLSDAVDVKAGASHTMVLKKDGTVVAWGGIDGQSPAPAGLGPVIAIGTGAYHSLAVKKDGSVAAWGVYRDGSAAGPASAAVPAGLSGAIAVAGGYSHSVALKSDGTVVGWGDNSYGQVSTPAGLTGVTAIAAGHYHTVALKSDGTVVAWGRNSEGQSSVPAGLSGVVAIDAKAYHTVALKSDGTVVCWGDNEAGQSDVPAGLAGITAIAAGGHHTLALKKDGTIVCWGDDEFGQCTTPAGLVGVTAIAGGTYHTMAMKGNVAVVGWGHNISLQCEVPVSVYEPLLNGSIGCSPGTVDYGGSATCSVTPASGYAVGTLAVNGVDETPFLSGNSFTLSNVRAYQTVTATFTSSGGAPPAVALTAPAAGASFTAPAAITLTATATAGASPVSKVDFYAGTVFVGSATASPYSVTWNNVAAGSYSLTAVVTDSSGATTTSAPVAVTVSPVQPAASLPLPWSTQDVGSVGVAGVASYQSGTFTVQGSGADIWSTVDAFRFVYRTLSGDGQIVARVATLQNTNGYAKGGVMMRQSLASNSVHAMMDLTPSFGAEFSRRTSTGGSTTVTPLGSVAAPYWVKLVRSGNTFTGYVSSNGTSWLQVGSSSIPMTATIYVGLIVTSHDNSRLCTATIDSVNVGAGTAVTSVLITAPVNGSSYTAPASITVTASATAATGASVRQVDFYAGPTLIGSDTASPYGVTWNNVAAGGYSLVARVTDTLGRVATSAPVSISVTGSSGTRFVYDSFTESSTVALENHTGEVGATWTRLFGSNVGYIDPSNDGVYSAADVTYRASGSPPTADYSVIATLRAFSVVNGTNMGVSGRINLSTNSRYSAYFVHGIGWRLIKIINGSETVLGVYAPTGADLVNGTNYTVELRMKGTIISMYINGILGASVTDASLGGAGAVGVELHGAGAASAYELLDFQAM